MSDRNIIQINNRYAYVYKEGGHPIYSARQMYSIKTPMQKIYSAVVNFGMVTGLQLRKASQVNVIVIVAICGNQIEIPTK